MNISSPFWTLISVPLAVLVINLFWPRGREIKAICLVSLLLATQLHITAGLSLLEHPVAVAEHMLSKEQSPKLDGGMVHELRNARECIKRIFFDVEVVLTLGVVLAAIPVDFIARCKSKYGSS